MKRINECGRMKRLIEETIVNLNLNLDGMVVLTEIASGYFIVTSLIAALAGARKVYVVCKDSIYGSVEEIKEYLREMIDELGVESGIVEYVDDKLIVASQINIVTNSGNVRPIDREFIKRLSDDAAISLMFESWEYRKEDIDINACIECNIPIIGVNENNEKLHIFRYVAMIVLKLLFEESIEVFKSDIVLVSSGDYLREIKDVLTNNGANVYCIDTNSSMSETEMKEHIQKCDSLVFADQSSSKCLLGEESEFVKIDWLTDQKKIIHIAGILDYEEMKKKRIKKKPAREVDYGYMTVTTDYVGIRPVIELNAAGLKVGQELVTGMRLYKNYKQAQDYALNNELSMVFNMEEMV